MATTALFAEILVVGLLALPWITFAVSSATGQNLPVVLSSGLWNGVGVVVVLAFAYAAGIIIDRLGDAMFDPWDAAISRSEREARKGQPHPAPDYPDRPVLRFQLMRTAPTIAMEFLDYARSRRRILRGVVVNSVCTVLVAIVGLSGGSAMMPPRVLVVMMLIAIIAGIGGLIAWWHIGTMYFRRSLVAYDTYVLTPGGNHE